jgi:hypothetical protein
LRSQSWAKSKTDRRNSICVTSADRNPQNALEIAAAGRDHLLLVGTTGAGKSVLAARSPGILPELGPEEALETSMVHSRTEVPQVSFSDLGSHTPKGEASAVVAGRLAAARTTDCEICASS